MIFSLGIYSGMICFISWVLFDQYYLNRWKLFKRPNRWLKESYRRSIILNIAIVSGFFSIAARLLDVVNAFISTGILLLLITGYNSIIVTKNKALLKVRRKK